MVRSITPGPYYYKHVPAKESQHDLLKGCTKFYNKKIFDGNPSTSALHLSTAVHKNKQVPITYKAGLRYRKYSNLRDFISKLLGSKKSTPKKVERSPAMKMRMVADDSGKTSVDVQSFRIAEKECERTMNKKKDNEKDIFSQKLPENCERPCASAEAKKKSEAKLDAPFDDDKCEVCQKNPPKKPFVKSPEVERYKPKFETQEQPESENICYKIKDLCKKSKLQKEPRKSSADSKHTEAQTESGPPPCPCRKPCSKPCLGSSATPPFKFSKKLIPSEPVVCPCPSTVFGPCSSPCSKPCPKLCSIPCPPPCSKSCLPPCPKPCPAPPYKFDKKLLPREPDTCPSSYPPPFCPAPACSPPICPCTPHVPIPCLPPPCKPPPYKFTKNLLPPDPNCCFFPVLPPFCPPCPSAAELLPPPPCKPPPYKFTKNLLPSDKFCPCPTFSLCPFPCAKPVPCPCTCPPPPCKPPPYTFRKILLEPNPCVGPPCPCIPFPCPPCVVAKPYRNPCQAPCPEPYPCPAPDYDYSMAKPPCTGPGCCVPRREEIACTPNPRPCCPKFPFRPDTYPDLHQLEKHEKANYETPKPCEERTKKCEGFSKPKLLVGFKCSTFYRLFHTNKRIGLEYLKKDSSKKRHPIKKPCVKENLCGVGQTSGSGWVKQPPCTGQRIGLAPYIERMEENPKFERAKKTDKNVQELECKKTASSTSQQILKAKCVPLKPCKPCCKMELSPQIRFTFYIF